MERLFPLENFVPKEVQQQQVFRSVGKRLRLVAWAVCGLLAVVMIAAGVMMYLLKLQRGHDVPVDLQQRYDLAVKQSGELDLKRQVFMKAAKEDQQVVPVLAGVLGAKPEEVRLTRIALSDGQEGAIAIEGYATNPESFHLFVERLNAPNSGLTRAMVDKMESNATSRIKSVLIRAERL